MLCCDTRAIKSNAGKQKARPAAVPEASPNRQLGFLHFAIMAEEDCDYCDSQPRLRKSLLEAINPIDSIKHDLGGLGERTTVG